jgi:hypothetical protein
MQITSLSPPINGGVLYTGVAVSKSGVRYKFGSRVDGQGYAFRQGAGAKSWRQVEAPKALQAAVRLAIVRSKH